MKIYTVLRKSLVTLNESKESYIPLLEDTSEAGESVMAGVLLRGAGKVSLGGGGC